MLQPYLLFQDYSHYSRLGEGNKSSIGLFSPNSLLLAEGEGVTATSLGRPGRGEILIPPKLIHRVPSVEGATATSLGSLTLASHHKGCKEYFEKNAPDGLSHCSNYTNKEGSPWSVIHF
jgi:hypothetical protein